mmetsp:Transcript_12022/g.28788  ORF Transcript_12022/g.28788 Transcript_12022/m.28788 type:complete len:204 (-) Transcript_12022:1164-1775(-)
MSPLCDESEQHPVPAVGCLLYSGHCPRYVDDPFDIGIPCSRRRRSHRPGFDEQLHLDDGFRAILHTRIPRHKEGFRGDASVAHSGPLRQDMALARRMLHRVGPAVCASRLAQPGILDTATVDPQPADPKALQDDKQAGRLERDHDELRFTSRVQLCLFGDHGDRAQAACNHRHALPRYGLRLVCSRNGHVSGSDVGSAARSVA